MKTNKHVPSNDITMGFIDRKTGGICTILELNTQDLDAGFSPRMTATVLFSEYAWIRQIRRLEKYDYQDVRFSVQSIADYLGGNAKRVESDRPGFTPVPPNEDPIYLKHALAASPKKITLEIEFTSKQWQKLLANAKRSKTMRGRKRNKPKPKEKTGNPPSDDS